MTKKRSRRYPAKTITDADYANDIVIQVNTSNQPEILLHSLEWAAAGIGLHVNAHKTEYMCYNQTGDISTLDGTSLKLVDKFTYLGSSESLTEKDIDTRLMKAWTAIDRLSIIWKSDLTDKMKRSFFQAVVISILLYGCTTWTLTKWLEKKLDGNYTRMLRVILNKSWWQHSTRHQLYGPLPPIKVGYLMLNPLYTYILDIYNIWLGWVLWHINHCRLFKAKFSLYIYIKYIWFGLVEFYGISTIVGYLMPNPFLYIE